MQKELWQERAGKEVILSGDDRNDSPGHSAQYCTYTLADIKTKTILHLEIADVREVEDRKSANMERVGFERGMDTLMATDMEIKEVATDLLGLLFKFLNLQYFSSSLFYQYQKLSVAPAVAFACDQCRLRNNDCVEDEEI